MTSGSKEWFSKQVKELRRDFRALDSADTSIEYVTALIRLWGDGDITITSALHNMAVISYARTFTKQKRLDKGFDITIGDFENDRGSTETCTNIL